MTQVPTFPAISDAATDLPNKKSDAASSHSTLSKSSVATEPASNAANKHSELHLLSASSSPPSDFGRKVFEIDNVRLPSLLYLSTSLTCCLRSHSKFRQATAPEALHFLRQLSHARLGKFSFNFHDNGVVALSKTAGCACAMFSMLQCSFLF
jgi:hypothetical protein